MNFFTDLADKVSQLLETSPEQDKKDDDDYIEQQLLKEKHRYDSFAAVRHGAQVKFFIDGQNYCW
jgi:phospholipase D1/2